MKLLNFTIIFLLLLLTVFSCQSDEQEITSDTYTEEEYNTLSNKLIIPEVPFSYAVGNSGVGEKVDQIATFGRVLFYDKNLSSDGSVSCASCHQQKYGFADNRAFSIGPKGNLTDRNSISLVSVRSFGAHYSASANKSATPGLFWDERAETIAEQLQQTIANPNEMGMELSQIVDVLQGDNTYRILHNKAFDTDHITEANILRGIEAFINSFGSSKTRLEAEALQNLNFINGDYVSGTSDYKQGIELFKKHCNSCHGRSLHLPFDRDESAQEVFVANNGLLLRADDKGVFGYTGDSDDLGKFKVPGLLNIELTTPYMHDGRFSSLEEVVEFYNSGINNSPTLHPFLKENNEAIRLNLTDEEKGALVKFLRALTDESIATNEMWSNPFLY